MSESLLKPSVIPSIHKLWNDLRRKGLNEDDIITLLQRRTPRGVNLKRKDIKETLDALKKLERDLCR